MGELGGPGNMDWQLLGGLDLSFPVR